MDLHNSAKPSERSSLFLVIAAAAAAVGIRIYLYSLHYTPNFDELMLAVNIRDAGWRQLFRALPYYDQAAPLGYLLLYKLFVTIAGLSDWTMRLLPLLCTCAAILALAVEKRVPAVVRVLVLVCLALDSEALVFSEIAKQYGVEMAMSIFLYLAAIRLLSDWDRRNERIFFLAGALACFIITGFPVVFLGVIAGMFVMSGRTRWKRLAVIFGVQAVLYALYYVAIFHPAVKLQPGNYSFEYTADLAPSRLLPLLRWDLQKFSMLFGLWRTSYLRDLILCLLLIAVAVRRFRSFAAVATLAMMAVFVALTAVHVLPASQPRWYLFFFPWVCFAIGQWLEHIPSRRAALVLACVLPLYSVKHTRDTLRDPFMNDARTTLAYLRSHMGASPSTPYVITGSAQPFFDFYFPVLGKNCITPDALQHGYFNRCSAPLLPLNAAAADFDGAMALPGVWPIDARMIDSFKNDHGKPWQEFDSSDLEGRYDEYLARLLRAQKDPLLIFVHALAPYSQRRDSDLTKCFQLTVVAHDKQSEGTASRVLQTSPVPCAAFPAPN